MTALYDYKSENVVRDALSDAEPEECEALIGKTVMKVVAREHSFEITFTDGSTVEYSGNTFGGCAMAVSFEFVK